MHPLPPQVRKALRVWRQHEDGFLDQAALDWQDPVWRVVVVGKLSAGKSSLVNALAGRRVCATGLGGCTTAPQQVDLPGDVVLVDTPGMDDPGRAMLHLEPLLQQADAVVWVVDGLQPMSASEREVMQELVPVGTHLHLVVCRLDIVEPLDRPLVLERVETLAEPWAPLSLTGLDPRSESPPAALIQPGPWPSLRRVAPLRTALQAALSSLPEGPTIAAFEAAHLRVRESFREAVVRVQHVVEEEVSRGFATLVPDAMDRFEGRARRARDTFLQALRSDGAASAVVQAFGEPDIPPPPGRPAVAVGRVARQALGGRAHAARVLAAAAGRWLMEGEAALVDWAEATKAHPAYQEALRREQIEGALRQALETLQVRA